ncbi:MAG: LytR/AlgR family response regulator transcription factor [Acidaminococcaceae bacterium]
MQIAVVDDLKTEIDLLSSYIIRYCKENKLSLKLATFVSGEEILAANNNHFDIIFLDIYMPGLSGLETAKEIRKKDNDCLLVFSTTSPDFAVKSFRVRAFDYLVKPYDYVQLAEIMSLAEKALHKSSRYIEVKESREIVKILIRDILYADYDNHYIQIHTKDKIIRTYLSFPDFSPLLLKYPQFLNCYRNCIINMDCVSSLYDNDFALTSGERIPITRERRTEIRQLYADYAFQKLNNGDV